MRFYTSWANDIPFAGRRTQIKDLGLDACYSPGEPWEGPMAINIAKAEIIVGMLGQPSRLGQGRCLSRRERGRWTDAGVLLNGPCSNYRENMRQEQ
jgi:hypothetical protein